MRCQALAVGLLVILLISETYAIKQAVLSEGLSRSPVISSRNHLRSSNGISLIELTSRQVHKAGTRAKALARNCLSELSRGSCAEPLTVATTLTVVAVTLGAVKLILAVAGKVFSWALKKKLATYENLLQDKLVRLKSTTLATLIKLLASRDGCKVREPAGAHAGIVEVDGAVRRLLACDNTEGLSELSTEMCSLVVQGRYLVSPTPDKLSQQRSSSGPSWGIRELTDTAATLRPFIDRGLDEVFSETVNAIGEAVHLAGIGLESFTGMSWIVWAGKSGSATGLTKTTLKVLATLAANTASHSAAVGAVVSSVFSIVYSSIGIVEDVLGMMGSFREAKVTELALYEQFAWKRADLSYNICLSTASTLLSPPTTSNNDKSEGLSEVDDSNSNSNGDGDSDSEQRCEETVLSLIGSDELTKAAVSQEHNTRDHLVSDFLTQKPRQAESMDEDFSTDCVRRLGWRMSVEHSFNTSASTLFRNPTPLSQFHNAFDSATNSAHRAHQEDLQLQQAVGNLPLISAMFESFSFGNGWEHGLLGLIYTFEVAPVFFNRYDVPLYLFRKLLWGAQGGVWSLQSIDRDRAAKVIAHILAFVFPSPATSSRDRFLNSHSNRLVATMLSYIEDVVDAASDPAEGSPSPIQHMFPQGIEMKKRYRKPRVMVAAVLGLTAIKLAESVSLCPTSTRRNGLIDERLSIVVGLMIKNFGLDGLNKAHRVCTASVLERLSTTVHSTPELFPATARALTRSPAQYITRAQADGDKCVGHVAATLSVGHIFEARPKCKPDLISNTDRCKWIVSTDGDDISQIGPDLRLEWIDFSHSVMVHRAAASMTSLEYVAPIGMTERYCLPALFPQASREQLAAFGIVNSGLSMLAKNNFSDAYETTLQAERRWGSRGFESARLIRQLAVASLSKQRFVSKPMDNGQRLGFERILTSPPSSLPMYYLGTFDSKKEISGVGVVVLRPWKFYSGEVAGPYPSGLGVMMDYNEMTCLAGYWPGEGFYHETNFHDLHRCKLTTNDGNVEMDFHLYGNEYLIQQMKRGEDNVESTLSAQQEALEAMDSAQGLLIRHLPSASGKASSGT